VAKSKAKASGHGVEAYSPDYTHLPPSPISYRLPEEFGLLRLHIRGNWQVAEFVDLLTRVGRGYYVLNSLHVLQEYVLTERAAFRGWAGDQGQAQPAAIISSLIASTYQRGHEFDEDPQSPQQAAEALLAIADPFAFKLQLATVSHASPGWVEVLGAWNPIKVLADFLIRWRQLRDEHDLAKTRLEIERLRTKNELLVYLTNLIRSILDDPGHYGRAEQIASLVREFLPQIEQVVNGIASEPRITDVDPPRRVTSPP
jgi:hypothetical protein